MRLNDRIIKQVLLVITVVVCFTACNKENSNTVFDETYKSDQVVKIQIETFSNKVILNSTSEDDITVSLSGDEGSIASLKEGILKVNIPAPSSWINFKEPNPLYINVPDTGCSEIIITSTSGSIELNKIIVDHLTVKVEDGNIKLTDMEGKLSAISNMGQIETDLPIQADIKPVEVEVGAKVDGYLGDQVNNSRLISLYSNTGNIVLE